MYTLREQFLAERQCLRQVSRFENFPIKTLSIQKIFCLQWQINKNATSKSQKIKIELILLFESILMEHLLRYCYTYSEHPSLSSGSIHADITIQTISQQFQSEIRTLNAFNNYNIKSKY